MLCWNGNFGNGVGSCVWILFVWMDTCTLYTFHTRTHHFLSPLFGSSECALAHREGLHLVGHANHLLYESTPMG